MQRREFITLLGGTVRWPLAAVAQQPAMPIIGYLSANSGDGRVAAAHLHAFHQGLNEAGFVEGQNVVIEHRWAGGNYDRLPGLAIDLLAHRVSVIFATDITAAQVAKPASSRVPIVFTTGSDPVKLGLVASMNRPGGNMTGVSFLTSVVAAKQLEMLHEAVPNASVIVALMNSANANAEPNTRELHEAASILGLQLHILNASSDRDIDAAFSSLIQRRAGALLVASDPFLSSRADQLAALSALHAMPAIYPHRDYVTAGGLMSYGTSLFDANRIAGGYVGRILKGEKAGDLPVQQSTRVELIINMKAAKALGITFPITLLGRADEVIE